MKLKWNKIIFTVIFLISDWSNFSLFISFTATNCPVCLSRPLTTLPKLPFPRRSSPKICIFLFFKMNWINFWKLFEIGFEFLLFMKKKKIFKVGKDNYTKKKKKKKKGIINLFYFRYFFPRHFKIFYISSLTFFFFLLSKNCKW